MNHPDPHAVQLDYSGQREDADQRLIVVAEHGVHRSELAELIEHPLIQNIAGVQDGVCAVQKSPGGRRQPPPGAASTGGSGAEVSIGQDYNPQDPACRGPLRHSGQTTGPAEDIVAS